MASATFRWEKPPEVIVGNLRTYTQRLIAAIGQLGDLFAARMQAAAASGASWSDRTGAARQGLRGFAEKAATQVVIYLVHSVFYGVYLELGTSRMAPRPIIVPVLEAHHAPIMAALRALVGA